MSLCLHRFQGQNRLASGIFTQGSGLERNLPLSGLSRFMRTGGLTLSDPIQSRLTKKDDELRI